MSTERETKAMEEDETVERARAWDESKTKEKAEIAMIAAEAREKADTEDEDRVREKTNVVQSTEEQAAIHIRSIVEAKIGKKES